MNLYTNQYKNNEIFLELQKNIEEQYRIYLPDDILEKIRKIDEKNTLKSFLKRHLQDDKLNDKRIQGSTILRPLLMKPMRDRNGRRYIGYEYYQDGLLY